MFGLMKAFSCGTSASQRETRRLHYCGTCKSMGRIYGQKSRVLLNHDAVFLGELLMSLRPDSYQFAPAFVSKNCLSLPAERQIPRELQYAATANVALAQFKLVDHIADTGSALASLANRAYSAEFEKARELLRSWRFPLDRFFEQLAAQPQREAEPNPTLDRLAEPTAVATSIVFAHGAALSSEDPAVRVAMGQIGSSFGRIAYLADAIEDQEKDKREGAFNALAATGLDQDAANRELSTLQDQMVFLLGSLSIPDAQRELFVGRLRKNLDAILAYPQDPNTRRGRIRSTSVQRVRNSPGCCCDGCCLGGGDPCCNLCDPCDLCCLCEIISCCG